MSKTTSSAPAPAKGFDANKYVKKGLDADTVGKLKEVFDAFDYDGSGSVSTEELVNTIRALNLEAQAGQILAIVNNSGHQGDIDFPAFLDADTVGKLKEVFDAFDYDGSGSVSTEELVNTIRALNLEAQAGQILAIVNNSGHQGDIDFPAFLEIFGFGGDSNSETTLQTVFEAFDTTNSGFFGPEEFEKVAASVGEHFSSAEVDQMIDFADKDRDGAISYEEFVSVVTKVYPKV